MIIIFLIQITIIPALLKSLGNHAQWENTVNEHCLY